MLKLEDIQVGDLLRFPETGSVVTVGRVQKRFFALRFGDGRGTMGGYSQSDLIKMVRPPLEPGMWVRHKDGGCLCELGPLTDCGDPTVTERWWAHGELFGEAPGPHPMPVDPDPWIPVAPPQAEDTKTTAPATGETPASVEGEGAGPSVEDPSPVHFRAPASPYCVRCQGNPRRTECEECACWGSNAEGHTDADCPQSDETRTDEPDPTRWDRCREGRVFVRGETVISCRDGDWFVRRGEWESWDGYLTPRAAAQWADEHLPEGR